MATYDTHLNGIYMPLSKEAVHSHMTDGNDADLSTSPDTHNHSIEMGRTRRMPRSSEILSRDGSPTGSTRSYSNGHSHGHSLSTRRRISRSRASSWGTSYQRHHSSEVSKELTAQAEGEFFALTELMASMSRRSGSLREVWNKIIAERESCYAEMDRMHERIEEFSEIIEIKEKEHSHNHHEHEERQQEILKIRLQLKAASNSTAEFKTKLAERDAECRNLLHEIAQTKDSLTHVRKEHEEMKKTTEHQRQTLMATETARVDLEDRFGKLRVDRDNLDLKYTELLSRHEELNSKFDTQHKELVHFKQINTVLKKEKHEWLHREGEFEEQLRKYDHKHDEVKRKLKDLEERYEKKQLEVKELQETIPKVEQRVTKVKHEKTELEQHIEKLKRDIIKEHGKWEEAEDRCGKWKLKWEHSEREIASAREDIVRIELSHTELRDTISKKTEELRLLLLEKKRLEEESSRNCGRADENHRQLLIVQESLNHTESSLIKSQEEVHSKIERIEKLELDYNTAKTRAKDFEIEIQTHKSLIATLKLEVDNLTTECTSLKHKCRDWEGRYEEVCESVTEYEDGSSGFEFEISSMRTMLREAREHKEKAISARNAADRERDEAIAKYEEKCREMERLEERMTQHMHEQQTRRASSGKTVVRHFSKSGHSHMTNASEFGTVDAHC
ncbi:uncharacterized protein CTRU02_211157 [Colletotrichum truncatum]|uniref:Uncharacterized protein n=1 Tax=Colletotrichum truncatum TaxID=5467 RepID=A0ACC3YQY7_COLTU|nr:uncharacterized protein CTRU02_01937 [Colletotrichum truncatum]KAF6799066.1 hypothetical protein CTRU02_01937 [Colletotrichum truncatum]